MTSNSLQLPSGGTLKLVWKAIDLKSLSDKHARAYTVGLIYLSLTEALYEGFVHCLTWLTKRSTPGVLWCTVAEMEKLQFSCWPPQIKAVDVHTYAYLFSSSSKNNKTLKLLCLVSVTSSPLIWCYSTANQLRVCCTQIYNSYSFCADMDFLEHKEPPLGCYTVPASQESLSCAQFSHATYDTVQQPVGGGCESRAQVSCVISASVWWRSYSSRPLQYVKDKTKGSLDGLINQSCCSICNLFPCPHVLQLQSTPSWEIASDSQTTMATNSWKQFAVSRSGNVSAGQSHGTTSKGFQHFCHKSYFQ